MAQQALAGPTSNRGASDTSLREQVMFRDTSTQLHSVVDERPTFPNGEMNRPAIAQRG